MYWRALKTFARRPATTQLRSWAAGRCYSSQDGRVPTFKKTSKPLRILFCGSDEFSSASLRALHDEQRRNSDMIASIDVLCRPGKPSGRSLKRIREVPIKAVAQELGLPVHEKDTFTGWDLPEPEGEPINLIIAVSFGLFVPPRILRSAEYGGLNVHPSILPNFRGPAPLQYTIMANAQQCGVTLQTLDEESFDNGTILAQTPPHGLAIPFKDKCTYPELLSYITPIAANMLVQGLRDRVFVPPLTDVGWLKEMQKKKETEKTKLTKIIHAPKITSADKWINWTEESAIPIERRYRALGRLWSEVQIDTQTKKRIVFEDMELVPTPEAVLQLLKRARRIRTGIVKVGDERKRNVRFMVTCSGKSKEDLKPRFFVVDGDAIIVVSRHGSLRVKRITVEGKGKQDARAVFEGLREWDLWNVQMENFRMIVRDKGGRSSMTDKGWSDKSVWEDVITKSEGAAEEERDQASDETQGVNVRYHPFN